MVEQIVLARVVDCVHWPSDAIFGAILGVHVCYHHCHSTIVIVPLSGPPASENRAQIWLLLITDPNALDLAFGSVSGRLWASLGVWAGTPGTALLAVASKYIPLIVTN